VVYPRNQSQDKTCKDRNKILIFPPIFLPKNRYVTFEQPPTTVTMNKQRTFRAIICGHISHFFSISPKNYLRVIIRRIIMKTYLTKNDHNNNNGWVHREHKKPSILFWILFFIHNSVLYGWWGFFLLKDFYVDYGSFYFSWKLYLVKQFWMKAFYVCMSMHES